MLTERGTDGFFSLRKQLAQRDLHDRAPGDIMVNSTVKQLLSDVAGHR